MTDNSEFNLQEALQRFIASDPKRLDLSTHQCRGKDVAILAGVIANSNVQVLDLSNCNMDEDGTRTIAECLPQTQLITLTLSHNRFGKTGTQALLDNIPKSALTLLISKGNALPPETSAKIEAAVRQNADTAALLTQKFHAWECDEEPFDCSQAEWQDVIRLSPAIVDNLSFDTSEKEAMKEVLLTLWAVADKANAAGLPARDLMLASVPLPEVIRWAEHYHQPLKASDFLKDDGSFKDGLLCHGGPAVLFKQTQLWEDATQARLTYQSLSASQKPLILNYHQLQATLSRQEQPSQQSGRA